MQNLDVHNVLIDKLMSLRKIPSYAYGILNIKQVPMNRYEYWNINILVPVNINWEKVHITNFTSTIDTKLRSFYFKVFHKTIALNGFLCKITRRDSPNCVFCDKFDETMVHLFCDCEKVSPIWEFLLDLLIQKHYQNFNMTNFEKLFGVPTDKFLTYLMLLVKYFVFICKFKDELPNIVAFKSFVKKQKETEYFLAKKRNKLPLHFRKWRFDFD